MERLRGLDEETRVLGDSFVKVRNESMLRSWSSPSLPPTQIPCLDKVLLLSGRESALEHNMDETRMAF